MVMFAIAFLSGDVYLQMLSHLPSMGLVIVIILFALIFTLIFRQYAYVYLIVATTLGFAWSAWYAHDLLAWSLPADMEGKPITIRGYVASLPVADQKQTRFLFSTNNALFQLTWREPTKQIRVGDEYQFSVTLKHIHAIQNPGAFDYEAWSLQKGLRATGSILESKRLSHHWYVYPVQQLRQHLQHKITKQLPTSATSPWLMALMLGERNAMPPGDWQILRNTGTNHLMAIAGLHIGMIAGVAHLLVMWCWRRVPYFTLRLPAQLAGGIAALVIGIIYSALAGFSIPTERACFMLVIIIAALLVKRQISHWYSWSLAMMAVLLINPLSILTESFWLSFVTIALIIYGMSERIKPTGLWWKWGRVQWVIGLGLTPLSLYFFQESSMVSFLANSIAIPWLGFLILPFCLLSMMFVLWMPFLSGLFLWLADKSLAGLWWLLTWFAHLPIAAWQHAIPRVDVVILAIIGIVIWLVPRGLSGRWLGISWLLPLIFYQAPKPNEGDYWVTLLDVGQGLSVVVQTKNHTMVYDAGPRFSASNDMGESVVLPYLRLIQAKAIDTIVISHGDNDHAGGVPALLRALPVKTIKVSVLTDLPNTSYCQAGQVWQWDDVRFTFLYPDEHQLGFDNDSSCVLLIDNGKYRVLLPGDIEAYAEKALLAGSVSLNADVLIAPHHGSKTSGLPDFIAAVHPRYVLYATGYRNRYHFPHESVMQAYQDSHATQLNTVDTGAMLIKLEKSKAIATSMYRELHPHYWY